MPSRTARIDSPKLSPANKLYLYDLLVRALGPGKQTFLPRVEEALAAERLTADDLGFASTRELLEQLSEFAQLTVFKGGRVYVTVVPHAEFDAALAAAGAEEAASDSGKGGASNKAGKGGKAAKGNKPWKRKKGAKTLKPVCPKRVKRPEPEDAGAEAAEGKAAEEAPLQKTNAEGHAVAPGNGKPGDAADQGAASPARSAEPASRRSPRADVATPSSDAAANQNGRPSPLRNASVFELDDEAAATPSQQVMSGRTAGAGRAHSAAAPLRNTGVFELDGSLGTSAAEGAADEDAAAASPDALGTEDPHASQVEADAPAAPKPTPISGIELTVVYNPYTGIEEETKLVAEVTRSGIESAGAEPAAEVTTAHNSKSSRGVSNEVSAPVTARAASGAPVTAVAHAKDDRGPAAAVEVPAARSAHSATAAAPSAVGGASVTPAPGTSATGSVANPTGKAPAHIENQAPATPSTPDVRAELTSSTAPAGGASSSDVDVPTTASNPAAHEATAPAPAAPAISLTVTYDPATAPTEQGTPRAKRPAPRAGDVLPLDGAPSERALAAYPRDFSTDVRIPGDTLAVLAHVVPLHADAHAILTEDFRRARGMGAVRGTRSRATFPLRYQGKDGKPLVIGFHRATAPTTGWILDAPLNLDEELLAASGIDGLPLRDLTPAEQAVHELTDQLYLDEAALDKLAQQAFPAVWDAEALRTQIALAARGRADALDGSPLATGLYRADGSPLMAEIASTDDDIPWRLVP